MNGSYKYNKFQKSKYYNFNKQMGRLDQISKPFYSNTRFQNYKIKNPLIVNFDSLNNNNSSGSIQLTQNLSQSATLFLNSMNPESMTPEQQAFLKKKLPNYRLLGRNIFDTNVKNQFIKSRKKTNTYYSRFLKQHPANNLPLAFQKSMSLAEDKALEEREKQQKKDKKKKHKKNATESENELFTSNSDSDFGNEFENEAKNRKSQKFYSDISSDSELDSIKKKSKKKDKKKKKKKKKQLKNKVRIIKMKISYA